MRTEGTAAVRMEGTAVMRIIASRRASVLGTVSHDAGNTTPQGYGIGTAVMRCVASQRAAHQAGTSRHIVDETYFTFKLIILDLDNYEK